MDIQTLKSLVESSISGAEALVEGGDGKFQLTVISADFEGLSPVKKQQLVYGCLNEYIVSGEVHAVSMQTLTPDQWKQQQKFSL